VNKNGSYIKMLIIYFFLTTPIILIFTLASIPEAITIQPTISSRIFFWVMLLGLWWIFYYYVNPAFKDLKYKTIILIISIIASTVFFIISLSY